MDADIITKYFPNLTDLQKWQYEQLGSIYTDWNAKINVISRKDIDSLYDRHVLHSLAIAKFFGQLTTGTSLLDMGTGGGFPGIPLAIMYPHCTFHLIDRIGKKIKVAQDVARQIKLDNVSFQHGDIGECRGKYDFVVSRAVMKLDALVPLIRKNISHDNKNKYKNGLVCLKGGDLAEESESIKQPIYEYPISEFFHEDFFSTKKLIYLPM